MLGLARRDDKNHSLDSLISLMSVLLLAWRVVHWVAALICWLDRNSMLGGRIAVA